MHELLLLSLLISMPRDGHCPGWLSRSQTMRMRPTKTKTKMRFKICCSCRVMETEIVYWPTSYNMIVMRVSVIKI